MKRASHLPLLALTTALALSLGGCMAKTTSTAAPAADSLPQYQQNRQALRAVQAENRLAALQPTRTASAGATTGLVLLRRTEPVERPPSPEELEATITRLSNAVVAAREGSILEAAAKTSAEQSQVAAARAAVQSRDLTLAELQKQREETARQLELLKQQAGYEAQLAELKATQTALQQARLEAEKAEARSKEFTIAEVGAQKAASSAQLGQLLAESRAAEARTQGQIEATTTKLAALTAVSAERIEANQRVADAKIDAVKDQQSTQFRATLLADKLRDDNTRQQMELVEMRGVQRDAETRQQLEDLAQLTATNQKLMRAETQRMGNLLADYSTAQVNQLQAATNATLERVATVAKMDVDDLRAQTAERLETMQTAQKAEFMRLAKAANNSIVSRVAQAEKKAEDRRLKPAEVKDIATNTIRESAPQFRALALQTLADSQDYIRATARTAVKDDPDTKLALRDAARDVITKDNQIVFAIRKVVDKRIASLPMAGPVAGTVPDGRPANTYNGEEIALEADRLGVAPEAIEPGAGPTTTKDGQQIAALPTANNRPGMMRARQRHDWIDLRKYRVVLHEDGRTLPQMVGDVVARAEPYTGPWEVKWKVSRENHDLLTEKFSLDTETTFEEFVNYLANYMVNERGVKLSFSLFDSERVLVISD
jgi:hypothetical protein